MASSEFEFVGAAFVGNARLADYKMYMVNRILSSNRRFLSMANAMNCIQFSRAPDYAKAKAVAAMLKGNGRMGAYFSHREAKSLTKNASVIMRYMGVSMSEAEYIIRTNGLTDKNINEIAESMTI